MQTQDKVFLETLKNLDPSLVTALGPNAPSALMFSNTSVSLPPPCWTMVKDFISEVHTMSRSEDYRNYVSKLRPNLFSSRVHNESVLMSYDFHLSDTGPKLIEVNTNASLSLYASVWTEARHPGLGFPKVEAFLSSFEKEAELQGLSLQEGIFICDEAPTRQKAYGEFILYQELFRRRGYPCEVVDLQEVRFEESSNCWVSQSGGKAKSIYNRWTDFYLTETISQELRKGWESGLLLTPQPIEYGLLADKQRTLDWSSESFQPLLQDRPKLTELFRAVLPTSKSIREFDRTMGRPDRAKWFFKPRSSFGSRGVYEGAKITNKAFEDILLKDYIAQEFVPAPTIDVETTSGPKKFKWDLRVYAYRAEAILPIARLYIGQTTNSQTEGGGLAPVQVTGT